VVYRLWRIQEQRVRLYIRAAELQAQRLAESSQILQKETHGEKILHS